MRTIELTPSSIRFFAVLVAVHYLSSTSIASAATTTGADFEIPISELNKVKKKITKKQPVVKSKKAAEINAVEAAAKALSEGQTDAKQAVASQALQESAIAVLHTPYSFVVPERPTEIFAVLDSRADIHTVTCLFRSGAEGTEARVRMHKVSGTQFTYSGLIDGVPSGSPSLRYSIEAVDSLGNKVLTTEFTSPVTALPIIPDWQSAKKRQNR